MCKHYYTEGQRIASKIGGGLSPSIVPYTDQIEPITSKYVDIKDALLNMCYRADECVGFDYKYVTYGKYLKSIDGLATEDNKERDLYFYHSDHIGSSSFITDASGIASQHLQYLPFGELFVEQRSTANYYTPYKFSGKEKDEETSYSYFGARYYMSDVSVWLSVDPLAEKAPGWTPYRYCFNNPIKLIDPDGRSEGAPDWYEPAEGNKTAKIWFPGNAPTKTVQGETYNNIGSTFSEQLSDGKYVNYYQNYTVSIGRKQDGLDAIRSSKALMNKFMSSKSFPTQYKVDIIKADVAGRGVVQPDLIGIQFSGNLYVGGGGSFDITLGFVKGEGAFANASLGAGIGWDQSLGIGIITGTYYGNGDPTSERFTGGGSYQSISSGIMNVTFGQDIDKTYKQPFGNNWRTTTIGITTPSLFSISSGVSVTTPPLRSRR